MMSANEFRRILAELELSQPAAAKWLDVDERNVRRWASGRPIPLAIAMLLILVEESGYKLPDLTLLAIEAAHGRRQEGPATTEHT